MTPATPGQLNRPPAYSRPPRRRSLCNALSRPTRLLRVALFGCLVGLGAFGLPGCGVEGAAFDGGGVPDGKTRMAGRVVSAENPLSPLANATVTLTDTPPGKPATTLQTVSDATGAFAFPNIPTGKITTDIQMVVTPPISSDRQKQVLVFRLTKDRPADLIATLPRADYVSQPTDKLLLTPSQAQIRLNDTIVIEAAVVDALGNPQGITPSLFFDGSIGDIGSDGSFHGTGTGTGTLYALWYNGLQQSIPITVDNSTPTRRLPRLFYRCSRFNR